MFQKVSKWHFDLHVSSCQQEWAIKARPTQGRQATLGEKKKKKEKKSHSVAQGLENKQLTPALLALLTARASNNYFQGSHKPIKSRNTSMYVPFLSVSVSDLLIVEDRRRHGDAGANVTIFSFRTQNIVWLYL